MPVPVDGLKRLLQSDRPDATLVLVEGSYVVADREELASGALPGGHERGAAGTPRRTVDHRSRSRRGGRDAELMTALSAVAASDWLHLAHDAAKK